MPTDSKKYMGKSGHDQITGFKGVVTAVTEYITGCDKLLLTPKVGEDNKPPDSMWVDVQCFVFDETAKKVVLDNGEKPGFGPNAPML